MAVISSKRYPTRELANFAVQQLVLKGVPLGKITIRDENAPEGLNLGGGLLTRVVNAAVSENEDFPPKPRLGGYIVEVQIRGGDLNEAISRHVFGYLA